VVGRADGGHKSQEKAIITIPSKHTYFKNIIDNVKKQSAQGFQLIPAPLYLRTLWRYTNAVIIIIIITRYQLTFMVMVSADLRCTDNRPIISIGRLSAILPIIDTDQLVRWYPPTVVYTIGKYKCLFLLPKVNKHDSSFRFW